MPHLKEGFSHMKRVGLKFPSLYFYSFMLLFWAIFDGIMSYIAPLVMVQNGLSETLMGIILGTSSIAGALFDFIICKTFKSVHYRRLFIIVFAASAVFSLILLEAKSFSVYIIAMAIWGFYYDVKNFGDFDYVGRFTEEKDHSSSFGIIGVFLSVGYLIAPLLAGFLIGQTVGWKPFIAGWIFLAISIIFFITLVLLKKNAKEKTAYKFRKVNVLAEIGVWEKIGKVVLPALVLVLFLNILDSFFWTIGPIFSQELSSLQKFGSLFMVAYMLPSLFVGWFIGSITRKFGKKKTAFVGLLVGSLLLSALHFAGNPLLIILVVFLSSVFVSMSWPSIDGAFADYISETSKYEKEIEGLEDFSANWGYIIGPMLAGFLAETFSNIEAFSLVGVAGIVVSLVLLKFTPKSISVPKNIEKPVVLRKRR